MRPRRRMAHLRLVATMRIDRGEPDDGVDDGNVAGFREQFAEARVSFLSLRRASGHEQKRLPLPLDRADDVLDERDVVRAERLDAKLHVRLLGRAVPLAVVAAD